MKNRNFYILPISNTPYSSPQYDFFGGNAGLPILDVYSEVFA